MSLSTTTEELVGADVRVSVHPKTACRVELQVKVSSNIVRLGRKNAIKTVSKDVTLPGFRKGKAPDEMILKKFPNDVAAQLHKAIADLSFVEAQKLAKIPVLNNNATVTFDLKSQNEEGAELIFTFETEPKVPSINPKQFEPKEVDRPEVGEKQIEEAVRQMMFFYAKWTPITDRTIQEGDFIMIDLDTIDGETPQRVFNHVRFEVNPTRMANWMHRLVVGAKSGEVLEGVSEVDETATEAEKAEFKPKKVRVSILNVEQAVLPELDDEFAKKVGAPDIAAMRQSITQILQGQAEEKVMNALREQVNDFLVATYPFDLPASLIETEKKHRLNQMLQEPKFKRNWERLTPEKKIALEEKIKDESAHAVRLFYLSRQVVNEFKLPISHKEVQDEAVATLQAHGTNRVQIDQIPKEVYALALSKVILAKAQKYIIEAQKA